MAEQQDDIEITPPKSKKKLLIIIIAGLVLVLGGLAAAYFLTSNNDDDDSEVAGETAETTGKANTPKAAPIYHEVANPFIVNFAQQSNDAVRFLQIKMKIMARDQKVIDDFVRHEPAIIHELLILFFSQNYDDLNTSEGTRALQEATLKTINEQLSNLEKNNNGLEAVYFTSLVMQ